MYLSIESTAEHVGISIDYLMYCIRQGDIRVHEVDGETMINTDQFDFFIKQREKHLREYQEYLLEPIPEDVDIKDED